MGRGHLCPVGTPGEALLSTRLSGRGRLHGAGTGCGRVSLPSTSVSAPGSEPLWPERTAWATAARSSALLSRVTRGRVCEATRPPPHSGVHSPGPVPQCSPTEGGRRGTAPGFEASQPAAPWAPGAVSGWRGPAVTLLHPTRQPAPQPSPCGGTSGHQAAVPRRRDWRPPSRGPQMEELAATKQRSPDGGAPRSRRHSQREQEGQHSPSARVGLAQVAGGQAIWRHTVLNFCKRRRTFVRHSWDVRPAPGPGQEGAPEVSPGRSTGCSCPPPRFHFLRRTGHPASKLTRSSSLGGHR